MNGLGTARVGRTDPPPQLLSVAAWYSSGVFLSITNKHLMLYHGFKFPIALTFVHMVMCALLSNVAVVQCRLVEREALRSRDHFRRVCVLAAVFAGTVLMGNWSLKYVHVSFTLMVGATTPFFTAALAYLLQRRTQAPLVYAALVPVIGGSVLAAYGEVNFHLLGYLLALGATVARAFKSLLQGELLQSPEDKLHSQNLLRFMCPIAAGLLFVPALAVEGRALHRWVQEVGPKGLAAFLPLFGANVLCAYGVNLANFLVTRFLGPLTLQVLGQAKGVVTTSVAVVFFGNAVSALAWVGYTITLSGVSLYIAAQHGKARLSPAWPCVGRLGPRRYAKVGGPA